MAAPKNFVYVIYEKDLKKDIEKLCKSSYQGQAPVNFTKSVPFEVGISMSATNPEAIQNDRVLKKKIRKITDAKYVDMLKEFRKAIISLGDSSEQVYFDALWNGMQNEIEKVGNDMVKDAYTVLEPYMRARGEGKIAKSKFKYNKFKSGVTVVGAVAGTGVAVAVTATATVATMGASIALMGLALAGMAKAVTATVNDYKRQSKSIDKTIASINDTIKVLNKNTQKQSKIKVSGKEVLAKMTREWAGFNIKSIKKLEQDTKLLKQKAQVEVLQASKIGAFAGEWHSNCKALSQAIKNLKSDLAQMKANFPPNEPAVTKKISETEKMIKKLEGKLAISKKTRDDITVAAQSRRKAARNLIKEFIEGPQGLEETATVFKKCSHDIGWTAYPIKLVPALAALGVSGGASLNSSYTAAESIDALADLALASSDTLQELTHMADGKLKIAKRMARA